MELQHRQLLDAALKMGMTISDVSEIMGCDAAILSKGVISELLLRGTPVSFINQRAQYYFDNKQLTKKALQHLKIPAPASILFNNLTDKKIKAFFQPGKTYVCKPPDGTNGVGVKMNIRSLEEINHYYQNHKTLAETFLLEEQITGTDLRVQVVGGKIAAACTRVPAFVEGDGQHALKELIEQYQLIISHQNPANNLEVNEETKRLLAKQNIHLSDIPVKGHKIRLKEVANMAQGAIAIDLTDELHSGFQLWIDKISEYLKTSYFGIDIIALNHSQSPDTGACVLEINARPEWLHHTFSKIRKHDMAMIIIKELLKNTS